MNNITTIRVEKRIDADLAKVKSILLNLDNYPRWWKKFKLVHDKQDCTISFKPIPFVNLKLKLLDKDDHYIKFQYIEGPFQGTGIWEFRELEDGKIFISYTINISGRNKIYDKIIPTLLFKWKHTNDIDKLMALINKQ